MFYILIIESESIGIVECKIKGLNSSQLNILEKILTGMHFVWRRQENNLDVELQGVTLLNILSGVEFKHEAYSFARLTMTSPTVLKEKLREKTHRPQNWFNEEATNEEVWALTREPLEMKDVIRVTPENFHQSLTESITTLLNIKLANKVVLNVGLCIALFDITHIGHSYIFPGDGSSHTEVKFRYIVFRPVVEEILIGKIRSCSREGVHVTLGFFDDILIPVNALQHPSRFDETDQAWVWEYPKEDGEKHDLFMDSGESIRFRVTSETFEESFPAGPPGTECPVLTVAPYRLVGGINEPGLGLLTWWESPEPEESDNEEQDNDE